MKLEEVLALRPVGAGSAEIAAAIARAEELGRSLTQRAGELERTRGASLLTADEKTILRAEQEAATARLTADRIEALLPAMRSDLSAAQGQETLDALRADLPDVTEAVAALHRWQADEFPRIGRMIGEGFQLQDAAQSRLSAWLSRVDAAYQRQDVRDAGPLDAELPSLKSGGILPRAAFSGWH